MNRCLECSGPLPYAGLTASVCSEECVNKLAVDQELAGNAVGYYDEYGLREALYVAVGAAGVYIVCQHNMNDQLALKWSLSALRPDPPR